MVKTGGAWHSGKRGETHLKIWLENMMGRAHLEDCFDGRMILKRDLKQNRTGVCGLCSRLWRSWVLLFLWIRYQTAEFCEKHEELFESPAEWPLLSQDGVWCTGLDRYLLFYSTVGKCIVSLGIHSVKVSTADCSVCCSARCNYKYWDVRKLCFCVLLRTLLKSVSFCLWFLTFQHLLVYIIVMLLTSLL